jgi:hypothetical protein
MGTRLEQHVTIDPEWPTHGEIFDSGERVALADVERLFPVDDDRRANVFFWAEKGGGERYRVWPWKNAAIVEVDEETGEPVFSGAGPDVPLMSRDQLVEVGLDDEKLEAERKRLVRKHAELRDLKVETAPGPDTHARMVARRALYDALTRVWYTG